MCGGYIKIKYNKTTTSIEIVGFDSVFIKAHKTDSDGYKPQYPTIWRNANSGDWKNLGTLSKFIKCVDFYDYSWEYDTWYAKFLIRLNSYFIRDNISKFKKQLLELDEIFQQTAQYAEQKYRQFKNFDSELQNFSDDREPDFKLSEAEFNKIIKTLF